ncbi:MAG: hypothetical protein DMF06_11055 [Verrucomicrobia bacterium]|nr:MAG: hypothetical protein DMF06_11055 [Verrucomicrobiota bacterium]
MASSSSFWEIRISNLESRISNFEWSEWDERHRRQSCEGSSERARDANEFQTNSNYRKRNDRNGELASCRFRFPPFENLKIVSDFELRDSGFELL